MTITFTIDEYTLLMLALLHYENELIQEIEKETDSELLTFKKQYLEESQKLREHLYNF